MAVPVFQLERVQKTYGRGDSAVPALVDVDLTIRAGDYVAIMGPSGSGKSTLLHLLGCLDRPTAGRILIEGQDVSRLRENDLARLRNRRIGFVFQQFHLMPHDTVLRNVEWPMVYAGVPARERRERATRTLGRLGLGRRLHHLPSQLSGGERQRTAIARALVSDPAVILADEPTGNLDSASGEQILGILDELHREGHTVVVVTHDPDVAAHMERLVRVRDGRVTEDARHKRTMGDAAGSESSGAGAASAGGGAGVRGTGASQP